jgi:hypothetical protein
MTTLLPQQTPKITVNAEYEWANFTTPTAAQDPVDNAWAWANIYGPYTQYYWNDINWPWIAAADGNGYITFFGDGTVARYKGPSFTQLKPSPGEIVMSGYGGNSNNNYSIAPGANNVSGAETDYNYSGSWMHTLYRTPSGTLLAFLHCENHYPQFGNNGQWQSTGLWASEDDGLTWVDYGEIVGIPQPPGATGTNASPFGGSGIGYGPIFDPIRQCWFGLAGGTAVISTAEIPIYGTWYAMDGWGDFSVQVNTTTEWTTDIPGPTTGAIQVSGVATSINSCQMSYNTYLNQYVAVWQPSGNDTGCAIAFSSNGITWVGEQHLYGEGDGIAGDGGGNGMYYPALTGDETGMYHGQQAWLQYMRSPNPYNTNLHCMTRRLVQFQIPNDTPSGNASESPGQCGITIIQVMPP